MEGRQRKPANYLVFDGGRSALSALYIIEEICSRLQFDLDSDEEVRVCDYCDLLGGSGTGAVAAILLGRMGHTPSQAIAAYLKLEPALSAQPTRDEGERRRNSEAFKAAFTEVLMEAGFTADTPMMDKTASKTVIWTLSAANLSIPQPIRSYRVRSSPGPSCTILEAACASIASPNKFLPAVLGSDHKKVVLVDAMSGYANPTKELLKEAEGVFGDNAEVASIVSLGAGKEGALNISGIADADSLVEALKRTALDSERTHEEMYGRLNQLSIYFRFNIERGLEGQIETLSVYERTAAYMKEGGIDKLLDNAIKCIKDRQKGSTLVDINSVTAVEITLKPRPSLVENFVGREDILDALKATHFSVRSPKLRKPAISVLMGLGGSGKTQTALRFALDFEERYRNAAVYFFIASSEAKLKADFELSIRARDLVSRLKSHDDALVWFTNRQDDWLIIMDNADDPSVGLFRYIPKSSHGSVIITTRNSTYKTLAPNSSHHVEGLASSDAIDLILRGASCGDNESNRGHARKIADALGHLPLALAHAAGYISVHRCLPTYLSMFLSSRAKFLASKPTLPQDYDFTIAATVQMSLDRIPQPARDVMVLLSLFEASSIAQIIIAKSAEFEFLHIDCRSLDEAWNPQTSEHANTLMNIFCPSGQWLESDFNDIVQECLQYSLLQVATQGETQFYSMHVLVQAHLQSISTTIQEHRPEQLVVRLLGSSITIDHNYKYQAFNRLLVPHLRLVAVDNVVEAGDHVGFGHVLGELGNARISIEHYERYLALRRGSLDEESMGTLGAMHVLAMSYHDSGRYQDALNLKVKVVDLYKRVFGDEHINTLLAMCSLALSLSHLGQLQEAVELQTKLLVLWQRISYDENPQVQMAMGNLAATYNALGKHQEALELQVKVLDLRKRVLGDENPETLRTMGNLAVTYSALGKYQEAMELQLRVLDLQKRISGDEHPQTIIVMDNLASTYFYLGRPREALELQEVALETLKQVLGEEHSDTIVSMCNLATTLYILGMKERAISLLQAAVPLQEKALGMDHSYTVGMKKLLDYFLKPRLYNNAFLLLRSLQANSFDES